MNWRFLLLFGIVLMIGCHETANKSVDSTLETAVISCEAAHVTVGMIPSSPHDDFWNE